MMWPLVQVSDEVEVLIYKKNVVNRDNFWLWLKRQNPNLNKNQLPICVSMRKKIFFTFFEVIASTANAYRFVLFYQHDNTMRY